MGVEPRHVSKASAFSPPRGKTGGRRRRGSVHLSEYSHEASIRRSDRPHVADDGLRSRGAASHRQRILGNPTTIRANLKRGFTSSKRTRIGPWVGHLVKGFKKPGEKFADTCAKCAGDQKNAKMPGLAIVNGMKRDGLTYKEGTILDPRDGSVYHAQMELSADGKELGVRGYLGIPMFGQTTIWKRLPDDAIPAADLAKMLGGSPQSRSRQARRKPQSRRAHSPASSNSSVDPAPAGISERCPSDGGSPDLPHASSAIRCYAGLPDVRRRGEPPLRISNSGRLRSHIPNFVVRPDFRLRYRASAHSGKNFA